MRLDISWTSTMYSPRPTPHVESKTSASKKPSTMPTPRPTPPSRWFFRVVYHGHLNWAFHCLHRASAAVCYHRNSAATRSSPLSTPAATTPSPPPSTAVPTAATSSSPPSPAARASHLVQPAPTAAAAGPPAASITGPSPPPAPAYTHAVISPASVAPPPVSPTFTFQANDATFVLHDLDYLAACHAASASATVIAEAVSAVRGTLWHHSNPKPTINHLLDTPMFSCYRPTGQSALLNLIDLLRVASPNTVRPPPPPPALPSHSPRTHFRNTPAGPSRSSCWQDHPGSGPS